MIRSLLLGPCILFAAGVLGAVPHAQIKSLTLPEMVAIADGAVYGEILRARVFRVDSATDGPELYFTALTIQGRSLNDERSLTLDVTFRGGFVSPTEGVFNSEAPAADDVAPGKRVVAFYRWCDDLGGGVRAHALVAAHGGLYRTVDGPRGTAVLGRGTGYAVGANVRLDELGAAVHRLAAEKPARR